MTTQHPQPSDVSAVICTKNSIASIQACLQSLEDSGVGEIIVVDASSTDGTREIAESLADLVLEDPGTGLGQARNIGIAASSKAFILNMGSDNVMPPGQLQRMLMSLSEESIAGVSAQTRIAGSGYVAFGLNTWRSGRFRPGPAAVIGTPTLLRGELLRLQPFDPSRSFSDDSELCERWFKEFDALFEISDAYVMEEGKATWSEVLVRCRMYGVSDAEVFRYGVESGWGVSRRLVSLIHPLRRDLFEPISVAGLWRGALAVPFLLSFTILRYKYWAECAFRRTR